MDPRFTHDLPENYYYGGGGDTFMTPAALVVLLLSIGLLLLLPRRYVVVPLLVAGIMLPFSNTLVIGTIHLPTLRLLLMVCWVRILLVKEMRPPRLNVLDKAILIWAISNAICYSILWNSMGAVTNRAGFLLAHLGIYFALRGLVRSREDVMLTVKTLACLVVVIAPFMLVEHFTGQNLFAFMGAPLVSELRNGAARASGPLGHPIIAGTIGAMMLPLFVGAWLWTRNNLKLYALAGVATVVMAYSSSSSTPIFTWLAGVGALLLWRFRAYLPQMRWAVVILLLLAHLVMKAPVWMLLARAGGTLGGSGYHRAMLIDSFINHFSDWWMFGTRNNAYWGYDMWDVDNAFVGAGISGGLVTFVAFIAVMFIAFRRAGEGWHKVNSPDALWYWALGSCLFANAVGFFGIVYFDQSILIWYALLAFVAMDLQPSQAEPQPQSKAPRAGVADTWRDRRSRLGSETRAPESVRMVSTLESGLSPALQ